MLHFYNTRTRRKEIFAALESPLVRMYSCGPTVYDHQHLGNMRSYVFADLLKRTLRLFGFQVRHVINITDVGHLTDDADAGDDKVEMAARRQGLSVWEIAEKWTRVFVDDLARLNVCEPDVWCKATDHIADQIEMIRILEQKGFTYRTSDGVYFDTSKDPHYGELRPRDLEAQETQERISHADEKRARADFALWKLSSAEGPARQMEWDSPWGRGFPGWHIECAAMSSRYLGRTFDIHTGGIDHVPIHHPNEIAEAENAFGVRPWVRFWMHNGWLMQAERKMAKSAGGFMTLDDLVERGVEPLVYRYFLLNAHYRQQINFSDEALAGAQTSYQRLLRHAVELRDAGDVDDDEPLHEPRERFRAALADDLNSPQGLAVVWEVVRSEALSDAEKWILLSEFDQVLGLDLAEATLDQPEIDERVAKLIREREEARRKRDFARSDRIRAQLEAEGIVLEDTAQGTRWRRA